VDDLTKSVIYAIRLQKVWRGRKARRLMIENQGIIVRLFEYTSREGTREATYLDHRVLTGTSGSLLLIPEVILAVDP